MSAWYYKYAAITITAAVGLGGYEAVAWSKLTPSDWGTWVGSIGTIFTLIGTIWLATAESRIRRIESITSAQLRAAGMLWHLVYVQALVSSISVDLEKASTENVMPKRTYADDSLHGLALWGLDELLPLIPLRGDIAVKLAQAADQIRLATSFLSKTRKMDASEFLPCAKVVADMLRSASALLIEVIDVCKAVENSLSFKSR